MLAAVNGWAKEAGPLPAVAVVRAAAWSQGDAAREGAAELEILMEVARLRRDCAPGGLIAVGDRRGLFSMGAEEALRYAVLLGVPVVKLTGGGRVLPAPHGLFLDGGSLSEEAARQVLNRCLEKYGALPSAGGDAATPQLHARLQLFQREFALASSTRLAAR
jgi:hypothetical protein